MHRPTTTRTTPTSRSVIELLAALWLLGAAAAAFARESSPGGRPPYREAFLAGTRNYCRGCDLREARLKRRDLSGADLTGPISLEPSCTAPSW